MRTDLRTHVDTVVELFGGSAERIEFERSARDRANEPQTAVLLTPQVTTITLTLTICLSC